MNNENDLPNQINDNVNTLFQQESLIQSEMKMHNVVFTLCQINRDNQLEIKENFFGIYNLFQIEHAIKSELDKFLMPGIFSLKKIYMPINQDVLFFKKTHTDLTFPVYVLELNICITFFPNKKIKRVKTQTIFGMVFDTMDLDFVMDKRNSNNISLEFKSLRNSSEPNPLQRFKYYLIK